MWLRILGGLLYFSVWAFAGSLALFSVAWLYGFRVPFGLIEHSGLPPAQAMMEALLATVLSYFLTIYGFAITYTFLSHIESSAFNVKIDFWASMYFSIVTIATVGYGDIVAVSTVARAVVCIEIIMGLAYTVFVLSIVGGAVREQNK
jgi:hypothetical protein